MPIPPLSEEQRRQARDAATQARRRRAEVKERLRNGELTLAAVLELADTDEVVAHTKVMDILKAQPRIGEVRAAKVMERLKIAPTRRLRGLGRHQVDGLIVEFPPDSPSRDGSAQRPGSAGDAGGAKSDTTRLVVLSGPTAVGKGTVVNRLRRDHPDVWVSVSATTREPRPGEQHGVHYLFVSEPEFDRLIADGDLLEWAVVHGAHRYGTPRRPVLEALAAGRPAILELDLQGARQVRRTWPEARFVFLAPPTWEELLHRQAVRGTEDLAERERRLETARREMAAQSEFDVTIVNTEIGQATQDLVDLLRL